MGMYRRMAGNGITFRKQAEEDGEQRGIATNAPTYTSLSSTSH